MFTKARGYSSLGSSGSQEEIPTDSSEFDHEKADINGGTYQRIHGASFHQTWPWISLTINILLVLVVGYQHLQLRPLYSSPYPPFPRLLYSPAQDAISYTLRTFTDNDVPPSQQEPNPYLGPPTAEIDAAWNELYNIGGINQISNSEAAKLSESTAEVLDEDGFSFMGLDVFHQLHCLNWVRHGLRPERYWEGMEGWSAERRLAWDVHNGQSKPITNISSGTLTEA